MIFIQSVAELQAVIRDRSQISVRAGGTKTGLSAGALFDISALSGVVEYEPSEYTFTARAATKLKDIQQLLAAHGQFMAFDPVLVEAGGTIGGTIASGLSGPGRFRYGGVRDFLLGLRLVNGEGDIVRGGGKVVKNAAGFDIPKLMVGSLGRYGIVTEATFKVFPRPESYATLRVDYSGPSGTEAALEDMAHVAMSPAEAACLEFIPPGQLLIRVGGIRTALTQRIDRINKLCRGSVQRIEGDEDEGLWSTARELAWRPADQRLVRIPIAPRDIPNLENRLIDAGAGERRYSVGGHLLWLGWPNTHSWSPLESIVREANRTAQIVMGDRESPLMNFSENEFGQRLLKIFDPQQKFGPKLSALAGNPLQENKDAAQFAR